MTRIDVTSAIARARLLIVADNAFTRKLLRDLLRGFGCRQIEEACDAAEAGRMVRQNPPDLALVDWRMPDDGGARLLQDLAQGEGPATVPVLVVTSARDQETVLTAHKLGARDVLAKPIVPGVLRDRITRILVAAGRPGQQRAIGTSPAQSAPVTGEIDLDDV